MIGIGEYKESVESYYRDHKQEIAKANLLVMQQMILLTIVLFVVFILITPLLFQGWKVKNAYWLMVPLLILFFAASCVMRKIGCSYKISQAVCILFYFSYMLEIINIDVLANPDAPAAYFPLLMACLPLLFNFLYNYYALLSIGLEFIFILCEEVYKLPMFSKYDIFNSLVGMFLSFAIAWIVTGARIREGKVNTTLKKLGTMDYLTGIYNRSACEKQIVSALQATDRTGMCALFIIDLDNFKFVNDKLGHQVGDELLAKMGDILSHMFRAEDIVGRFGGDEFVVFLREVSDKELLRKKSKEMLVRLGGVKLEKECRFTCSIGIALAGPEEDSFERLYHMADEALYEAKSFGKGRFVIHVAQNIDLKEDRSVMLIADADEKRRRELVKIFQNDYEIVETSSGVETLSALSQYNDRIAALLLDIYMPEQAGFEIIRYMKSRKNYENMPIIVISGDKTNEEQVMLLGATAMLTKKGHTSFDAEDVRKSVAQVLKKET